MQNAKAGSITRLIQVHRLANDFRGQPAVRHAAIVLATRMPSRSAVLLLLVSMLNSVKYSDMEVLISSERIRERVTALAQQIAADYGDRPITIVGVLTGSLVFLADLVRQLNLPLRIGLVQASSYRGANTRAGQLQIGPELLPDVRNRHVLLVDDILDTGK